MMLNDSGSLSGARIASTGANGNVQKIYTAVILTSFSRTEAIAQDNVRIISTHGGQMMIGSALKGNGGHNKKDDLKRRLIHGNTQPLLVLRKCL